jgi:hypothetical protein
MSEAKTLFHSAKEGLIDIKPVELKFIFNYEILNYPLLALIIFLFTYIVYQTLKIKRAKRIVVSPFQEARKKLEEFIGLSISNKEQAEYLAETLKNYLHRKGIKNALALDSRIENLILVQELCNILNNVENTNISAANRISESILEILKKFEEIEYTLNKQGSNEIIQNSYQVVNDLIGEIDIQSIKPKQKKKRSFLSSKKNIARESR